MLWALPGTVLGSCDRGDRGEHKGRERDDGRSRHAHHLLSVGTEQTQIPGAAKLETAYGSRPHELLALCPIGPLLALSGKSAFRRLSWCGPGVLSRPVPG